jgi:hypothetical protein
MNIQPVKVTVQLVQNPHRIVANGGEPDDNGWTQDVSFCFGGQILAIPRGAFSKLVAWPGEGIEVEGEISFLEPTTPAVA